MSLPYFPMFPADFEAKTSHLSLLEDGVYNRLLRICWMTPGCSIPADDEWIMRRMRATTEAERAAVKTVLGEFFTRSKGRLVNKRLSEEFDSANAAHERRVKSGSEGGKSKSLKNKTNVHSNAIALPTKPEPEPEPEPDKKEEVVVLGLGTSTDEIAKPSIYLREKLLEALGADPLSGITATGKRIGTQADMAMVAGWLKLPGITEEVILAEVRQIMAARTGKGRRPQSIAYFAQPIANISAAIITPPPPGTHDIRATPPPAPLRPRINPDDFDDKGKRIRPPS